MEIFGIGLAILIPLGILLFLVALPLFALIDIIRSDFKDSNNKLIWVLIVLFFPILGSILYFIFAKDQKLS